MEPETPEQLQDRKDQVGLRKDGRIYISPNTFSTALGLLFGIAGHEEGFPEEFDRAARQKDANGNPEMDSNGDPLYDLQYAADHVPFNVEQLEGRRFVAYFDYGSKGQYLQLQMFSSYAIEEEHQEIEPRDLFAGEDSWSYEVKKRQEKKNASRDDAVDDSILEDSGDEEFIPDDELPF